MKEGRFSQVIAAVLISAAVFAALGSLRASGTLQPLELLGYDLVLALRSRSLAERTPEVALVAVTEADIGALGAWPMPDAMLRDLLATIDDQGARVIGLDIYRDVSVAPGSEGLRETLAALPNLVAIYKFASPDSPGVGPPAGLAGSDQLGFSDVVVDAGGVVRRGLAFLDDGDRFGMSFALRVALGYLAEEGVVLRPDPDVAEHFMLGDASFAPLGPNHGGYVGVDAGGYQFMIDYRDLNVRFPRYRVADVLNGRLPENALRDRIVLIGVDAVSVKDAFATPRGQWGATVDRGTAGIALHGVVVEQLLRAAREGAEPLGSWPDWMEYASLLVLCMAGGLFGLQSRSARRLLGIGVGGSVVIWVMGYVWFRAGTWIPVIPLTSGWLVALALVTGYLLQRERTDRALLQRMFATQTSKDVAETLWERRRELLDEGGFRAQTLTATVLFVDLGGFTGVSERLPAERLMEWVHRFMEVATQVVVEHGGMVDDYFGDGLKANFGAPFPRESPAEIGADALAAVDCALALQQQVELLNQQLGGLPTYRARVGIHTGSLIVGGVGNVERQKYTSIGDTVNVAARLEAVGKELCGADANSILISGATAEYVTGEQVTGEQAGTRFDLRDHGAVELRGRASAVQVFQVLGPDAASEVNEETGYGDQISV